jgi:purine nucleoside phosphorylase
MQGRFHFYEDYPMELYETPAEYKYYRLIGADVAADTMTALFTRIIERL